MFWTILFAIYYIFHPVALADDITPTPISPTPTPTAALTWGSGDTNANRGNQFNVNVQLSNAPAGAVYHIRVYGAPSGSSCDVDLLYNGNWSNGCYVGNDAMPSFTVDSTGRYLITMNLRAEISASSGTYYLYSFIPELNLTGSAYQVTINDPVPTSTPTLTPTVTPTPTITPIPTVIPTDTPLPILTPVVEATPTDSPQDQLPATSVSAPTPSLAPVIGSTDTGFSRFLPLILIIFGGLLLSLPLVGPKIIAKIKSKKTPPPTIPSSPVNLPSPPVVVIPEDNHPPELPK